MEVPGKKMETADGESTESVVLQCTSSGDVEDGEEVVRSEPVSETLFFATTARKAKTTYSTKMLLEFDESDCEEEEVMVRYSGVRAWLANIANDTAYWNSGGHVRPRRCKAPKGYVEDVGEAFVIDRTPVKRKYEKIMECSPVSESELDEGSSCSESDDEDDDEEDSAASSSDSDVSESEYENTKRRRRASGDESTPHLTFPSRKGRQRSINSPSQEDASSNCDNEMKEMQVLLELQLKASERRETEMKQRMETMMDLMSRHMGHVEKRVSTLEVGSQPQEQMLERINVKLEKVMEGFTTLNENLSILSACLSKDLDSQ